jgi:threonine-phosphate decarboxylase
VSAPRHGGNVFAAAQRLGVAVSRILDFSANINPLGPSPKALRRLRSELRLIQHYPDGQNSELRALVAKMEGADPNCLLFGNGATQLLHLVTRFLRPTKALILEPGFAEYEAALRAVKCKIHRLYLAPEVCFCLEPDRLFGAIRHQRPDLIVLANPNNPTGKTIPHSVLLELCRLCSKKRIPLLLDESFIDFTREPSFLAEASRRPYLFVVRSLTKFWALAGLRIGLLVAQRPSIKKLSAHIEPWSVNTLASAAAAASLRDSEYRRKTRALVREERAFLSKQLSALGWLMPYASAANFLLVHIEAKGLHSNELCSRLEKRNILVRDAGSFPGLDRKYIRIAVRSRADNQRLIKELRTVGRSFGVSPGEL